MCGIFFSLCRSEYVVPDSFTEQLLKNRGPDKIGKHQILIPKNGSDPLYATFISTVLSLRGRTVVEQPLRDHDTGSILSWNGEAWTIAGDAVEGNDSQVVFDILLKSSNTQSEQSREVSIQRVVHSLSRIRGPFAFIFYDAKNHLLYYGRDCLGRRSLLRKSTPSGEIVLSSVCDNSSGEEWAEVEADGIYLLDLLHTSKGDAIDVTHIPHRRSSDEIHDEVSFILPFPTINQTLDQEQSLPHAENVKAVRRSLQASLKLRVENVRELSDPNTSRTAQVAILFSGGLDCTILARLCHDLLPLTDPIDLLNVAFENPRIHKNLEAGVSPYELCPDRVTARASHAELEKICPNRLWRLVEINVPYMETMAQRENVMRLMHPHNTEMDLSISYALYFASRGTGQTKNHESVNICAYTTPAHVLLSGLGADELFGGYQRHAVAFARRGYQGLLEELALDFNRLGKRNLGRDDRVISDSGKEVRFPYLDEDFIALALDLPVYAKCDFAIPQTETSDDPTNFLEPGKRLLRLLAWDLDMKVVASEKKRAIQFGARTAKMETGKTKGTHVLS
ncbi:asparagine synthetase domain-containing protein 1 [Dendryphion nanum]|uniref:Asparagine synthetase domain-containing protein 1 n=1 Tax=Dendryphion nanum TaxID=256645 RepID=A0A9P9DBI6_9PLEO|nr:asparagine synthetase domain-containing protein 1 [Dendryphion nanum]